MRNRLTPVEVFENPRALARGVAARVAALLRARLAVAPRAVLVLAGGRTAVELLKVLPARGVAWRRVHVFWADERFVPLADPESNAGAARPFLKNRLRIPESNLHPFFSDPGPSPAAAAERFENRLRRGEAGPRPDVVFLGMGEDGHVASLFPGGSALREKRRWVLAVRNAPKPPPRRLTLTLPFLNRARHVVIAVSGEGKRAALRRALLGGRSPVPAARVRPRRGAVAWFADQDAAGFSDG